MPVPGHRFEREVMVLAEMALGAAQPDHRQHDGAERHVHAMEAGQHEECRAVDARAEGQVQFVVGVDVFLGLEEQEERTQQHSGAQPPQQRLAGIGFQGVVRHGDGHPGGQQQHGVQQRQAPGRNGFKCAADGGRAVGRPAGHEALPQVLIGQRAIAFTRQPRQHERARVEQRAEERGEEHHFREDEPHHAHAERAIDLFVVVALQGFGDDIAEPGAEHQEHRQQADEEQAFAP